MRMKRGDRAMLYILVMILAVSGVVLGIRYMTAVPDVMSAEITQDGKLLQRVLLKKEILPGSLLSNIMAA